MALLFLDANVIIRYLTRDNPPHAQRAYAFLQQVEQGSIEVTTTEAVIAEVVYVLSSKRLYNVPRPDIRTRLTPIIGMRGLKLRHKGMYLRALDLYAATNLDFVDALTVAQMERQGIATVVSFDRDFDRITTISRQQS